MLIFVSPVPELFRYLINVCSVNARVKFFQCPGILEQRVLLRDFKKVSWKLVKGTDTLTQLYFQSIELPQF